MRLGPQSVCSTYCPGTPVSEINNTSKRQQQAPQVEQLGVEALIQQRHPISGPPDLPLSRTVTAILSSASSTTRTSAPGR